MFEQPKHFQQLFQGFSKSKSRLCFYMAAYFFDVIRNKQVFLRVFFSGIMTLV
jgi:hypothetical protein